MVSKATEECVKKQLLVHLPVGICHELPKEVVKVGTITSLKII